MVKLFVDQPDQIVEACFCKHQKSINISYGQGAVAGRGGQFSYHVGCILFLNIKKQKKSLYFEFSYKKQSKNTNTNTITKNKLSNLKHKHKQKQHTTNNIQHTTYIVYKL